MARAFILTTFVLFTASATRAQEHTKDSLDTVKQRIAEKKAVLLDVREKEEWDAGHVRDALLLPLSGLRKESVDPASVLPKDKIIYCHCASGRRCLVATELLKKKGYDVRALKPGYNDLVEAGFPKADK
jgi:rhodanese-related sulfurtransferase